MDSANFIVRVLLILTAGLLGSCDSDDGNKVHSSADNLYLEFSDIYYRIFHENEPLIEISPADGFPKVDISNAIFDDFPDLAPINVRFYLDVENESSCSGCSCIEGRFCMYAQISGNLPSDRKNNWNLDPLDFRYEICAVDDSCEHIVHKFTDDGSASSSVLVVERWWPVGVPNEEKNMIVKTKSALNNYFVTASDTMQLRRPPWGADNALNRIPTALTDWSPDPTNLWNMLLHLTQTIRQAAR